MAKKARFAAAKKSVFTPTSYEVEIGENEYIIEPQPIKAIVAFDGLIEGLSEEFAGSSDRHYVIVRDSAGEEKDRHGPFEITEAEDKLSELQSNNGLQAAIESEPFDLKDFLEKLAMTPYRLLVIFIPDLEETDCDYLNFPQLMWLFDLLIEVNGINWFKAVSKNLIGPLLEETAAMMIDRFKAASLDSSIREMRLLAQESTD